MQRPAGMRVIIAYKLAKAPIMLGLALFMTLAPERTGHLAVRITHELAGGGAILRHLAHWLEANLTLTVLARARAVAWFESAITLLEAILLIQGKSWGEWLVIGGLALACAFEALSIEHRPSWLKAIVFVLNVAIVAYLIRRRLHSAQKIAAA